MNDEIQQLRQRIQGLDQSLQDGAISAETHRNDRRELEQSLVAYVMAQPTDASPDGPAATAPGAADLATGVAPPQGRMGGGVPRWLWPGAGLFVLAVAGALYWWRSSPPALSGPRPGPAAGPMAATQAPHPIGNDQIAATVQRLADRLKAQPSDAEGWAMLARSYANLGRHADALPAYAKAIELRQDDPPLMADYADELALQQGGRFEGEPMRWVKRALALEPGQPKALLLAGTEAFQRKDYAQAIQFWERVAQGGAPQSELVKQAKAGLDDARRLAGIGAQARP